MTHSYLRLLGDISKPRTLKPTMLSFASGLIWLSPLVIGPQCAWWHLLGTLSEELFSLLGTSVHSLWHLGMLG